MRAVRSFNLPLGAEGATEPRVAHCGFGLGVRVGCSVYVARCNGARFCGIRFSRFAARSCILAFAFWGSVGLPSSELRGTVNAV